MMWAALGLIFLGLMLVDIAIYYRLNDLDRRLDELDKAVYRR